MKIFPMILIVLDICAGLESLYHGNRAQFVYWLSAALISLAAGYPHLINK